MAIISSVFCKYRNPIVIGLVLIVQLFTVLKEYTDIPTCARLVDVNRFTNVLVNCDSAVFMKDVQDLNRLFNGVSDYQDRPLYVSLAFIIKIILDVIPFPERSFSILGNSGVITDYSSNSYIAFILVNLSLLVFSIFIAQLIVSRLSILWKLSATQSFLFLLTVSSLLSLNEITKTFFWTPHTQMMNIVVPIYAVYLVLSLQDKRAKNFFIGHSLGILLLTFIYPISGILLSILLFAQFKSLLYRILILGGAGLLYAIYPLFLEIVGGKYQSVTVTEYRQFVWILDLFKNGASLNEYLAFFENYVSTFPIVPMVFILSTLIYVYLIRRTRTGFDSLFVNFAFLYLLTTFLIGFYARRLTYGSVLFLVLWAQILLVFQLKQSVWLIRLFTAQLIILLACFIFTYGPLV